MWTVSRPHIAKSVTNVNKTGDDVDIKGWLGNAEAMTFQQRPQGGHLKQEKDQGESGQKEWQEADLRKNLRRNCPPLVDEEGANGRDQKKG